MQRALLIALVAASYLLFAGAYRWTLGPLLALAALGVLIEPRRTLTFPPAMRSLDAALLALIVAIGIQVIPLPPGVVSALSPRAQAIQASRQLTALVSAPAPAWSTLSINPPATLEALGVVVLGVLSFWIARAVFNAGGGTRHYCRTMAIVGAVFALAAVAYRAVDPHLIYGMVRPEARGTNPFGAFVNRNHFAGWLLLIVAPVTGYLLAHIRIHSEDRGRWRDWLRQFMASGALLTALADLAMVVVMLVTLSRSAVAGLAAAALASWRMGRPRLRVERTNLPALLGLAGGILIVLVMFVDFDRWVGRFEPDPDRRDSSLGRLNIWRETLPVVWDFWLTGTGAGTYSDSMTVYQQTRVSLGPLHGWAHFNNAHSHYMQVASEGGLLLSVPVAVALVALTRLGRRAVRHDAGEMFWVRIGAGAALAGLAVQSVWETSLIMPANAVLCGSVAGLLLYQRARSELPSDTDLREEHRPSRPGHR